MADDHRYQPQRIRGGPIVQSGIDVRDRTKARTMVLDPYRAPYRALVVNTRTVDDPANIRGVSVECDVVLVNNQFSIKSVPVIQQQHGVNNAANLWFPRPSTRDITNSGIPLNLQRTVSARGTFTSPATQLGDTDGDMVLIDFIEKNVDSPIIRGAITHERSNRVLTSGPGWREGEVATRGNPKLNESYSHHYGTEVRVNEQGDLLIDTVGAYSDPATEAPTAPSGDVRFRVKGTQRLTISMGNDEDVLEVFRDGTQLRIDLGAGATEAVILGDGFRSFFNSFLNEYRAHTHATGTGPSGPPTTAATVIDMGTTLLSRVAKVLF